MSLFQKGKKRLVGLVHLESADGKWTVKMIEGGMKLSDPKVADGMLRFTLSAEDGAFKFEGRLPKGDAKMITGSVEVGDRAIPVELERTNLKALDEFELQKEALTKATGYEVTNIAITLLAQAEKQKAKPEDVRNWADKAYKAAEPYGARVQAHDTLRIAEMLSDQDGYGDVAVTFARRAERNLDSKAKLSQTKRVLDILAAALKKAGKADEAKEVEARIDKLNPEIKPKPFAGRKAKSDRVVLVELFTGAECPPCLAADKAFDALEKTYKPGEVVLLEYHQHIPRPDPLTNPASERRLRYYVPPMESGTPMLFLNGKLKSEDGGGDFEASERYDEYVEGITPLLETPANGVLKVTAKRAENKVEITAEASEVDAKMDSNVRLRLALVEEKVQYKGGNGIPEYHHVVRDMPGGLAGIPVKGGSAKQSVTVDLDDLKKELKKYLENYNKESEDKFPKKLPEIELKNLRVVAFLQSDKTQEVMQAMQVDVKAEK